MNRVRILCYDCGREMPRWVGREDLFAFYGISQLHKGCQMWIVDSDDGRERVSIGFWEHIDRVFTPLGIREFWIPKYG